MYDFEAFFVILGRMNEDVKEYEVVVVGGGFAGIQVVHQLAKKDQPIVITLISNAPRFQYYPNLYRLVVGASVNQVSIPLVNAVPHGVGIIEETYTGIDEATHTITLKNGATVRYDYAILAFGSEPNYFGIDGMAEKSKSFLSIEKALDLNSHYIDLIKKAKALPADEAKMQLSTIVVGAGPAGVEMAGALPAYLKKMAKQYGVDPNLITISLLDSGSRVLSAIPPRGSAKVEKRLKKKGVTFYANHGVNSCDTNCIKVTDKTNIKPASAEAMAGEEKELHAGTIIWTAGTKISSAFATIPNVVMTGRKRIQVSPTLTLPNNEDVYIAGDGAGTPYSGLAQTAIDHGNYIAHAIVKRISNEPVQPYEPKQGIFVIPVGRGWALFNYKDIIISGFFVWLLRIIVDAKYFFDIMTIRHMLSMLKKPKQKTLG
jgi:NADH dehydrogenase